VEEECHGTSGAKQVGQDMVWGEAKGWFATAEAASRSEFPEEVETGYAVGC
jgi:hypothetical protein